MQHTILPGTVAGEVIPPCSKSYAQRALAAALLCPEQTLLHRIEPCDDTRAALRVITALGAQVSEVNPETLSIRGGLNPVGDLLPVRESGLATRLFTPVAALCDMPIRVAGEGTLLRRPMGPMIETLQSLGVQVTHNDGFLPLTVCGPMHGGRAEIDGSISSQFITGLLMALPLARKDTELHVRGAVSLPYIDMTIDVAERFGVEIMQRDYEDFYIPGNQHYQPQEYSIEGDWSAAAMLLVAGATAGEITLREVRMLSKQADTAICTALVRAGASVISDERSITAARPARPLRAFEFDATHCPDLFPALAALAANAQGVSVIRGTSRLIHKESNRAETLREEYGRLGIEVDLSETDVMRIRGGRMHGATVESHGDHRIAMSLAVAALNADSPVTILGTECVAKSYPDFFEDLARLS